MTPYTIRCFGELDFVSHIISICECLRDDLRAEGTAGEWSMASENVGNLEIADIHSVRDHLMSGFSLAIELAINGDPSRLMDLVEVTEVCGRSSNIGVDWKNMVATAFESRGLVKFRGVANLEAVLEMATELVSEIDIFNRRYYYALRPIGTSKRFGLRQ